MMAGGYVIGRHSFRRRWRERRAYGTEAPVFFLNRSSGPAVQGSVSRIHLARKACFQIPES